MNLGETEEDEPTLRAQLETLRRRLEESQDRTHAFVAMLAHELRAPLGAILMWTHVLRMGRESDREAALDAVEKSARTQSKLIAGLLDVTRAMAGRLRIDRLPVNMAEAARLVVEELHSEGAAPQVNLKLPRDTDSLWLLGDVLRLRQMLSILIKGALRRATADSGAVEIELTRVEQLIRIVIRDHGVALSSEELEHLFEAFHMPGEPSRQTPGLLGLELPLVRFLAELHSGTVLIRSDGSSPGSVAELLLPAAAKP